MNRSRRFNLTHAINTSTSGPAIDFYEHDFIIGALAINKVIYERIMTFPSSEFDSKVNTIEHMSLFPEAKLFFKNATTYKQRSLDVEDEEGTKAPIVFGVAEGGSKIEWRSAIFRTEFSSIFALLDNDGEIIIRIYSTDLDEFSKIVEYANNNYTKKPKEPTGNVWALATNQGGLYLKNIGNVGQEFIQDNYDESVIADLNHATKDLCSDKPCGRLIILNGPPGTGKTNLIKMLTKMIGRTFVFVPSGQVVNWTGPAFIQLLESKKDSGIFPLVLVIEDADESLVPRDSINSGNVNIISSLLNLTDGIIGSIYDLRIIASTNANITSFDPAVLRNGRLCRRIDIGLLKPDQANRIYKRISSKEESPFKKETCLADIYKYLNDPDSHSQIEKEQKRRIGFGR